MNAPKFPKHLACSQREWRTQKRTAFRGVLKAVEEFRLGCVYTPVFAKNPDTGKPEWYQFEKLLKQFEDALSIKKWGR